MNRLKKVPAKEFRIEFQSAVNRSWLFKRLFQLLTRLVPGIIRPLNMSVLVLVAEIAIQAIGNTAISAAEIRAKYPKN